MPKRKKKPSPRPVGRPKLHEDEAKSSIVPVRFSVDHRAKVEAAAKAKGISVSQWIREAIDAAL